MIRLGIDLGGTKIEGVALDRAGRELARRRVATPRGDYSATVAAIVELVAWLETQTGQRGAVGVGMPGAVSPRTGLVKNANSTWLIGKPFDRDLAQALERPVRVENDANCLAASEAADGAGAGAAIVFAAILGTGCGAGIAVHGRVLTGRHAIAGEWGHNPLPWPMAEESPGPDCYCGRQGCLETWVSGPGLAADHRRATGVELAANAIVVAALAGEAAAQATLERWRNRLGRGLAAVINLLDPDVIVLGGGLSNIPDLAADLPARIAPWGFSDHLDTPIRLAAHGDASGVRGAAWLWPVDKGA